ncbi:sialate:O-sulfotransferase 2-like [Antennarius striatus]|uniref:sialate:O-sulfotransferase 2-like n=1 Tax=Antennarius striatus TaxID=241820 RepID=UPI0035B3B05D
MLSLVTPEAVARYRRAKRTAASAVMEAKQRVWEEFREAMEKDYRTAPKLFWRTVRHLRRGKRGTIQAVYSKDGTLLTSTDEVVACDLQRSLVRFATKCEAAGMRISTSKSEAMVLSRKPVDYLLQLWNEVLPQVKEFKYLGVLFTTIASFPGSGNTWTRHLIELPTGFYTGSIYLDKSLCRHEFKGEGEDWRKGTTICVKTHEKTKESIDEFDSSILLIRNPYKAIILEFNRQHGGHTGFASEIDWKGTGWSVYVKNGAHSWHSHILNWLSYGKNIKVIYYEDLQRNLLPQLRKIVQFLGLKVSEDRLLCVEGEIDEEFKRSKKGNLEYNPYTPEMHANISEYIRIVDAALKEKQQPGLPEEYMAK